MEERKENMDAAQEAAHGAEAHTEEGAAAARLGKFKSVDALLNAYNSLEAEFTRRSQRLRELEARLRYTLSVNYFSTRFLIFLLRDPAILEG